MGFTDGRNEAWLRDLLAGNPDLLPIEEVAPRWRRSALSSRPRPAWWMWSSSTPPAG